MSRFTAPPLEMTLMNLPAAPADRPVNGWDAIVVGSGLGGLSAAAYLAAAGRRTLLLERYDVLGGCSHVFRRKRRWEFDVGVHYIGDCGPGGQVPTLLRGLGLDERIEFLPLERGGFDTIVGPDFELRVPVGWDAYLESLIAAFPAEERALRRYVRAMRAIGGSLDRSRTVASTTGMARFVAESGRYAPWITAPHMALLAACGLGPKAMLALSVQSGAYGTTPDVCPVAMQAGFLENFVGRGAWYPRGGGQVFAAAFSDVVRTHGGAVRTRAEVARILVEGGRVTGVRLSDGEVLRAPVVISDADIKRTYRDLVGYEHLPRRVTWRSERWKMAWPLINGYFGIELDLRDTPNTNYYVIPSWDDASSRLELRRQIPDLLSKAHRRDPSDWAADFVRRQAAFVQSSTRRDPGNVRSAPAGCAAVEAMTLAPPAEALWGVAGSDIASGGYRREAAYREMKERIAHGLLDRVEQVLPGARARLCWSELGSPATQERYTLATEGSCYGLEPRISQFGPFRPGVRTPIQGLLLAGTSTRWGPGTEGAMLSGLHAAGAALGRDLDAEIREGAVLADRSRLTTPGEDFDALAACRRLGTAATTDDDPDDDHDTDAAPILRGREEPSAQEVAT